METGPNTLPGKSSTWSTETPIPPVPGGEEREQGSPSTGDFVPESHPAASQAPGLIKEDPERTGSWGQGEGRTRPGLLPRDSEPEWGLFRVLGDEWNLGKTGPAQGLWPFGVPCPGRRVAVELPDTLESPPGCGSTSPPPTRGNSSPASELRTGGLEALFSQSISGLNNNNNCFFTFYLKTKRKQLLCLPTPSQVPNSAPPPRGPVGSRAVPRPSPSARAHHTASSSGPPNSPGSAPPAFPTLSLARSLGSAPDRRRPNRQTRKLPREPEPLPASAPLGPVTPARLCDSPTWQAVRTASRALVLTTEAAHREALNPGPEGLRPGTALLPRGRCRGRHRGSDRAHRGRRASAPVQLASGTRTPGRGENLEPGLER